MSVRVVARIRPLLQSESAADSIVRSSHSGHGCGGGAEDSSTSTSTSTSSSSTATATATAKDPAGRSNMVRIPNPKNLAEEFSFQFNSVYDRDATQQEIFDAEVTPTVKHLFQGYDVTLFAYGSTGTGKTHTMRGGKSLTDRGMIPRLLSSIYRRSRKIEKDSEGASTVAVSMSYYEIYNDRVFDLFEAPEKRTATGLPLRETGGGKTVVVGLSELPCGTLKEFESLYDRANANRSTSATKLNAHSSRSHAILCVKVAVTSGTEVRVSTASAIDLAGSEDNRRTGNDKDRMVESASINKSLFVLAQCVEAISKKQARIPYRESKMTRILSLGQNNGFTVMILNLAPVKSYHLDTLSSLNFANRTKKIEVREVENEPIFKGLPRAVSSSMHTITGPNVQRQPLRPLTSALNINLGMQQANAKGGADKLSKTFSVYSDRDKSRPSHQVQKSSPLKRGPDHSFAGSSRPPKQSRPTPSFIRRGPEPSSNLSKATIESLVEKKVSEILASRAANAPPVETQPASKNISEEVRRRLELIEQRLEGQEGARAEGLSYLLMAKQHQARGEDGSALKMYQLAQPYFPENEKLQRKIVALQEKIRMKREGVNVQVDNVQRIPARVDMQEDENDPSYHFDADVASDQEDDYADSDVADGPTSRSKPKKTQRAPRRLRISSPDPLGGGSSGDQEAANGHTLTPRTAHLLHEINSRDVARIKLLKGVGPKRAEAIVDCLAELDEQVGYPESGNASGNGRIELDSLRQLGQLRGVGARTVEGMRLGVVVEAL